MTPFELKLNNYLPTCDYSINGQVSYLCGIRKRLLFLTPEEMVRQSLIGYLSNEFGFPVRNMILEEPAMRNKKKGRVDLLICDDEDYPVLVVECKSKNEAITDEAINQAMDYDKWFESYGILITNGLEFKMYIYDNKSEKYKEVNTIPTYSDLLKLTNIDYKEEIIKDYERPKIKAPYENDFIQSYIDNGWIGIDTHPNFYPFIFNLSGWLYDEEDKIILDDIGKYKFFRDEGLRIAKFGNAVYSDFGSEYRFISLFDSNSNSILVSFMIMGSGKFSEHPKFGNSKGMTYLNVAIDNDERRHTSLQLRIDKHVNFINDFAHITHDGTITIGKLGQAKRQDLIDFVQSKAPYLIEENKVVLGSLNIAKEIKSSQPETISFLKRVIEYSLLRDDFRSEIKASR